MEHQSVPFTNIIASSPVKDIEKYITEDIEQKKKGKIFNILEIFYP